MIDKEELLSREMFPGGSSFSGTPGWFRGFSPMYCVWVQLLNEETSVSCVIGGKLTAIGTCIDQVDYKKGILM